jgi:hypothetical protein
LCMCKDKCVLRVTLRVHMHVSSSSYDMHVMRVTLRVHMLVLN